jgi:uncharacterized protein YaeQ
MANKGWPSNSEKELTTSQHPMTMSERVCVRAFQSACWSQSRIMYNV